MKPVPSIATRSGEFFFELGAVDAVVAVWRLRVVFFLAISVNLRGSGWASSRRLSY